MRIVYLTAGAAGMYCGSCLHDNALAKALIAKGHDVLLMPTYTPIQTDEPSVAQNQLFFGGLNVYLQQLFPWARWMPKWMDRLLSSPALVRWIASRSMGTTADKLGGLTVSMLQGKDGNQRKEVDRLVDWLVQEIKPDVIIFSNLLIGGAIPEIKRQLSCPIVVLLQGDDAFFDQLSEPYFSQSMDLLRTLAREVNLFLVHSRAYGQRMQERLQLRTDQWRTVPLSLDVKDFININFQRATGTSQNATSSTSSTTTSTTTSTSTTTAPRKAVGYLARLAPEKGLHVLVDAFIELARKMPGVRLEIAGWLGPQNKAYWKDCEQRLARAGLVDRYRYWGAVDRRSKLEFLSNIDVLCVPATHFEPKGLFVLESLAAGVPVVLPAHAAFPELIERLSGGVLVPPGDTSEIATAIGNLLSDLEASRELGAVGRKNVFESSTTEHEAAHLEGLLAPLVTAASDKVLSK